MAKYSIEDTTLTGIGDAIRAKEGSADPIPVSELPARISGLETGAQLPSLTNPGTAADLLAGKELIDQDGNPVTGTMPEAAQATPSISVSSAGLITASATQAAGHVAAGTKSATKQLTTKAAATITPGTANQTIAAGTYLTGAQTIKGDANLLAANIKSGVSIFGVAGTLESGVKLLDLASSDMTFSKSGTTVTLTVKISASKIYKLVAMICDTSSAYRTIVVWDDTDGCYVNEIVGDDGLSLRMATITYGTSSVTIQISYASDYSSVTPIFVVYE